MSATDTPGIADSAKNVKQPSLAELHAPATRVSVVTMSIKPRSAIGLAGHHADSVIWFDERGNWETSTAYCQQPAAVADGVRQGQSGRARRRESLGAHAAGRSVQVHRRRAGRSVGCRLDERLPASARRRRRSRLLRALADVTVRQRLPRADGRGRRRQLQARTRQGRPTSSASASRRSIPPATPSVRAAMKCRTSWSGSIPTIGKLLALLDAKVGARELRARLERGPRRRDDPRAGAERRPPGQQAHRGRHRDGVEIDARRR